MVPLNRRGFLSDSFVVGVCVLVSLGMCGGAGLGAWGMERAIGRPQGESVKAAVGAGLGRLAAAAIKLGIGVVIWLTIAAAAFWP